MFIVSYDIDGILLHHTVPPRQTVKLPTTERFCSTTFAQHSGENYDTVVQNPIILHDNARNHTTAAVMDLLCRW